MVDRGTLSFDGVGIAGFGVDISAGRFLGLVEGDGVAPTVEDISEAKVDL